MAASVACRYRRRHCSHHPQPHPIPGTQAPGGDRRRSVHRPAQAALVLPRGRRSVREGVDDEEDLGVCLCVGRAHVEPARAHRGRPVHETRPVPGLEETDVVELCPLPRVPGPVDPEHPRGVGHRCVGGKSAGRWCHRQLDGVAGEPTVVKGSPHTAQVPLALDQVGSLPQDLGAWTAVGAARCAPAGDDEQRGRQHHQVRSVPGDGEQRQAKATHDGAQVERRRLPGLSRLLGRCRAPGLSRLQGHCPAPGTGVLARTWATTSRPLIELIHSSGRMERR